MTTLSYKTRWELLEFSAKDESFTVLDKLANKRRMYHVPNLLQVKLKQDAVFIFTSNAKIMQLDLLTATRQFLSVAQLENLKSIQKAHNALHSKRVYQRKQKANLLNINHIPSYAFSNTIHSF